MKKLIFAMAIMAMTATVASAQQPQCDKANCTKTECTKKCDKPCDKKCDKPCDKKCEKPCDKKCDKPCDKKCDKPCEFEGLNLTDAQKEQIKTIQEERRAKCAQQKAATQEQKQQQAQQRKADRDEYLAKIKAVLTPEQYTAYLENAAKAHKSFGKGKPGKRFVPGQGRKVCDKAPNCPQPEKK